MAPNLFAALGAQEFGILACALALVFILVIRQNRKDFEEIEAWLAEERLTS